MQSNVYQELKPLWERPLPSADVGFSANTGRKSAHLGTSAC